MTKRSEIEAVDTGAIACSSSSTDHDRDARALEIRDLQKFAVTDPGFGEISLGLAGRGGIATRLMQFR